MTPVEPITAHRFGAAPERMLPLDVAELTDPDGDALTLTTDAGGIWFTCTTDGDEVTVGPFPADSLRDALKVLGAYTRAA
ncbi:hypothetical protein ACT3SQ_10055 [Brachybacterium sp. AOP42-C2-15]|uniref:hypothetical protein n=1 Tax=Brachybacterium sp. AOP42-C2-15 TaxID=3457670 RepID=UPI0040335096